MTNGLASGPSRQLSHLSHLRKTSDFASLPRDRFALLIQMTYVVLPPTIGARNALLSDIEQASSHFWGTKASQMPEIRVFCGEKASRGPTG
jgi:hypothetical protein